MNPASLTVLAVGAILAGWALFAALSGPRFAMQGKTRFWDSADAAQNDALKKLLGSSHLVPHAVERVWVVLPGAAGTNALAKVREIRSRAGVVNASTNLLDEGAKTRLLAELLPAEFIDFESDPDTAILPTL